LEIKQLLYLGVVYFEASELEKAKVIFETLLLQQSIQAHTDLLAMVHNLLGLIYNIKGDRLTAYAHFQTLLQWEDKNAPEVNTSAYLNMGALYTFLEDYDHAESLYKKGLIINKDSTYEQGWLLHRFGELYYKRHQYKESEQYLINALKHWEKLNYPRGECFTKAQLGKVYRETKSKKEAILFLKNILKKENDINNLCKIELLFNLGIIYAADKNYEEALNCFNETALLTQQNNIYRYKIPNHKQMVEAHFQQQDFDKAFKSFQDYSQFNEEHYIKDYKRITLAFQRIKNQLEKEKELKLSQQKEIQITEQLRYQKVINGTGFTLLLLSCLCGGSIYYFYRKQKKDKEILSKLNTVISQKQKDLEKANNEISYHKEELELQLVKKAMLIGKYGNTLILLKELIHTKSFFSQKDKVLHILNQLDGDSLTEDLNIQITKANQDFLQKLSVQFPNLTQNELRLCIFLKMNLNTKEIANITFKNIQSIKVARSRLRKKIGLTHNKMAISVFLNQL